MLTVLCDSPADPPPYLDRLSDRVQVRLTDAAHLREDLPGARLLFLWDFFSNALAEAWPYADALEWVHVAAAGVDTLLFDGLRDSEVVVTNARGIFDRPIAEFVLGAVLAHAKRFHESRDLQHQRVWRHRETETITGQHAMIVGTGAIGRETARLLRAVGMEVRGAARTARTDPDFGEVIASTDLAAYVGWADHVLVTAPLTDSTRGLIDADVLAAMKPSAHLVNIGRGPIVDEPALVHALQSGAVAAASLDVFSTEPLPADSPLWTMPQVAVSPHLSGDVVGWRDALAGQFLDNARRFLAGEPLHNVVDKSLGFVASGPPPEGSTQ